MTAASIIIPSFKRVDQTIKTIELIRSSKGVGSEFDLEIIVADATPDTSLQTALSQQFADQIVYVRPDGPGIARNKNRGLGAAHHEIVIFCDSDMEVDNDAIANTLTLMKNFPAVAGLGGEVVWRGGELDGETDRPRSEDRTEEIDGIFYVEAIYSRYFATYKTVLESLGGYDEDVFNMRGEGADLSVRYWRNGWPLGFDPSIILHHMYEAPDSAALRVSHPQWAIAKDMLLLMYKYQTFEGENLKKTIQANFGQFKDDATYEMLRGLTQHLDFIAQAQPKISKYINTHREELYDFKFLEVFSDMTQVRQCIENAKARLEPMHTKCFS